MTFVSKDGEGEILQRRRDSIPNFELIFGDAGNRSGHDFGHYNVVQHRKKRLHVLLAAEINYFLHEFDVLCVFGHFFY